MFRDSTGEVLVVDYEVIVLRNVLFQSVVLCQESKQFRRRSIVTQLFRLNVLVVKHELKQLFANTISLTTFMYVEVKHAEWTDFFDLAAFTPYEQFLLPYFK